MIGQFPDAVTLNIMKTSTLVLCVICVLVRQSCCSAQTSNLTPSASFTWARLWALGQIESGENDRAIGPNGEVSRYQILPKVWIAYFPSKELKARHPEWPKFIGDPTDEYCSRVVAWLIIRDRVGRFIAAHHRQPSDLEWYLLWNCPSDVDHPSRKERARAQRFANLCQRP
jgi:hypothetical protein